MSLCALWRRLLGREPTAPMLQGLRLTEDIAHAIERGEHPHPADYYAAAAWMGLDRDDALMSMFGEKGRDGRARPR